MYKERIIKLREKMSAKSIDAAFLISDHNRNYLSGFTGSESYSLITMSKAFFVTDSRLIEQAKQQIVGYEYVEYSKNKTLAEFVSELIKENDIKRLGFEENIVSFKDYNNYKEKFKCEFVPLDGIVEELRVIKDDDEINIMKKAANIADMAFDHMVKYIEPGMTEAEIGLELEMFMRKNGASALSFPSIVASGYRSSLPHGEATDKKVSEGEFLTLDYGCVYQGYCSDMTRTLVIGEPSEKMLEIYNVVLEAQKIALKSYKPGIPALEVDKIARDYISAKGYGDFFGHSLGHGVGREIHEAPIIGYGNTSILKTGMVVTDEPGIYLPGFGGVRIEDILVITDGGCEILSKSPKEMICIKKSI